VTRFHVPSSTQTLSLGDALLAMAEAEEMRRSLKAFVVGAWSIIEPQHFQDGYVVDAICDHLTALTTGQLRFLLINIPPRHSKSTICSVLWPVWCWLRNPADRFLCASYGLNLAIRDNLKKRNLIESRWFQDRYGSELSIVSESASVHFERERDFGLSEQQNAKRFFMNDKMGYQLAVSVGSTTTGEGGSKLLIDDPHSATEAHSQMERESAVTWFRETWSNRMNDADKDVMLVIGQRIHEEDVSGVIIKERPDWTHLNLPAEYEPTRKCYTRIGWSDWRTEEGQLLWPERFNDATLTRYKRDLGSVGYAAQYQQSPVPSGGGQFRKQWFRYFGETQEAYIMETPNGTRSLFKNHCSIFGTVDLAVSSKQTADYTVIAIWALTNENDLLLIDLVRDRFDNPSQQKQIELLHQRYRPDYFRIESVGYQLALIQQLLVRGVPCEEYRPVKDKVSRASTASIWMENGKFYFLKSASWLNDVESELLTFPMGAHDDIVDNVSMAADAVTSPMVDEMDENTVNALQNFRGY